MEENTWIVDKDPKRIEGKLSSISAIRTVLGYPTEALSAVKGRAGAWIQRKRFENVEKIDLSQSAVRVIQEGRFAYLQSLAHVHFHDATIAIEGWAFNGCGKLNDIVLPRNLRQLGERAFGDCPSLVNVTLPATTVEGASNAFEGSPSPRIQEGPELTRPSGMRARIGTMQPRPSAIDMDAPPASRPAMGVGTGSSVTPRGPDPDPLAVPRVPLRNAPMSSDVQGGVPITPDMLYMHVQEARAKASAAERERCRGEIEELRKRCERFEKLRDDEAQAAQNLITQQRIAIGASYESRIVELERENESLRARLDKDRGKRQLEHRIAELEGEVAREHEIRVGLENELRGCRQSYQALEGRYNAEQRAWKGEKAGMVAEIQRLTAELANLRSERDRLEPQLEELNKYKRGLSECREEREMLQGEVVRLRAESIGKQENRPIVAAHVSAVHSGITDLLGADVLADDEDESLDTRVLGGLFTERVLVSTEDLAIAQRAQIRGREFAGQLPTRRDFVSCPDELVNT